MGSSLLRVLVVLAVAVPAALGAGHHRRGGGHHRPRLTHHGGAMLMGQIDISIMWYGQVTVAQKDRVLSFLRSLNSMGPEPQPTVAGWWRMVENYQGLIRRPVVPIRVNVVSQVEDPNASLGKVLVKDFINLLLPATTKGNLNTLALIVAARGISVQEMCAGKCAQHGVSPINGRPQLYVAVGDPELECSECVWPMAMDAHRPQALIVKPASGDVGADGMVMLLAGGLVEAVINPFGDGFYATRKDDDVENSIVCKGIFGSTWGFGNPGKLLVDPLTGGSFNAHGVDNAKFLLPAIYDPKAGACWTPL